MIPGVASGSYSSSNTQGITHATIGEGEIEVGEGGGEGDPLSGLNRDITKLQEITKKEENTYSIAIPLTTVDDVKQGAEEIKTATISAVKLAAEGISSVAKDVTSLLVQEGEITPESKERIDQNIADLDSGKITLEELRNCGGISWQEWFIANAYAAGCPDGTPEEIRRSIDIYEEMGKAMVLANPLYASESDFAACASDPACAGKMQDNAEMGLNGILLMSAAGDIYALSAAGAKLFAEGGMKAVLEGAKSGITGLFVKSEGTTGTLASTGRTVPANLTEKLAMEEVMANPAAGKELTKIALTDSRWPASQGWVKMQQIVNGVNVHYVRNVITGAVADFKFK